VSPRRQDRAAGSRSQARLPFRGIAAAALLAAGTIWWSAAPLAGGSAGTRLSLIVAISSGVLSLAQLALTAAVARDTGAFSLTDQVAGRIADLIGTLPWAELMIVATLALEALHSSRPWHTAVLAIALTGYLFAVHLAESGAGASVLRAQLPLVAAGFGLTTLAVGAAALPPLPGGPATALIRVAAVAIAVVVAGLVVPAWLGRSR
jgi:hypothetical protein